MWVFTIVYPFFWLVLKLSTTALEFMHTHGPVFNNAFGIMYLIVSHKSDHTGSPWHWHPFGIILVLSKSHLELYMVFDGRKYSYFGAPTGPKHISPRLGKTSWKYNNHALFKVTTGDQVKFCVHFQFLNATCAGTSECR